VTLDDALVAAGDALDTIAAAQMDDVELMLVEDGADADDVAEWRITQDAAWYVARAETLDQLRAELIEWLAPATVH